MNRPEYGKKYQMFIPGEPVAKSTQKPPRVRKFAYTDPKYRRLKQTWQYQETVALAAIALGMPQFAADDPIRLSMDIYKAGRKTGDTKNILAGVEDGIQYSGRIPNDRQVTSFGEVTTTYMVGKKDAGVLVTLELEPKVCNLDWLVGWLGSKKKAVEYQDRMGIAAIGKIVGK